VSQPVGDAPVISQSPEPAFSAPWYLGSDEVHALGETEIIGVGRPRPENLRQHVVRVVEELRTAHTDPPTGQAGAPERIEISEPLASRLERSLFEALDSIDVETWDKHLRFGLTLADDDTLVRVWFHLVGGKQVQGQPVRDAALSSTQTAYGDTNVVRTKNDRTSTSRTIPGDYIAFGQDPLSFAGPVLHASRQVTQDNAHALLGEVQSGSRSFNSRRFYLDHGVEVKIFAISANGHSASTTYQVGNPLDPDKVVTASHPQALGEGEGERPGDNWHHLADPAAIEQVDYTLGALDTEELQRSLLTRLIEARIVSPVKAAELFQEPVLDEKSLRDRSQFLIGGTLPSNFGRTSGIVNYQGFEGYIGLAAKVIKVQEIGTAHSSREDRGGIRNDIAETETVESTSTNMNGISVRAGADFGFGLGALTFTPLAFQLTSSHSTTSAVQVQPKTAIVRHGSRRRFETVLRIDVEIHAAPNVVWDPARILSGRLRSDPLTAFSVDAPAEILIPETQLERFRRAIGATPPDDPQPAQDRPRDGDREAGAAPDAEQARADARARLISLFGQPPAARAASSWVTRHLPLAHLALSGLDLSPLSRGTSLFPTGGLPSIAALVAHLAATRDPVTLFVPHGYDLMTRFTPEELDSLQALQAAARLRIFTAPGPDLSSAELTVSGQVADDQPQQSGDIELRDLGNRIDARRLDGEETMYSHQPERGYALDDSGVSYGWHGPAAQANPARPQAWTPAATEQPADPRARHPSGTQPTGLLAHSGLPDYGYVENLAGVPVWGWVPADVPAWGTGEPEQREALIGLLQRAGRSGVQLVLDPASGPAGRLSAAVESLAELTAAQWREFRERSNRALENHGAGLEALSLDELLRMLVTDRNIRIVDENGVVRDDLNARLTSVSPGGEPRYLTGSVALAPGEEYSLRADGRFSRSVTWNDQSLVIPHVRRAVSPSDPATETPELAAGLGLGTAAVKELPGAEKVHHTTRSLILAMISNLPLADPANGIASDPSTRYANLRPAERFSLDRQLQEAFGLPKLRAARSRGLDSHLHHAIEVAGRTYRVDVRAVKLGGDRPLEGEASGSGTAGKPVHRDRGHQRTRSEARVAVDHQAKGMRGGGGMVGRSLEAGGQVGGSYRSPTNDPRVAVDVGDLTASISYARDEFLEISTGAKHYQRMRSPESTVFRPEYPVRYLVTVTEISRSWAGNKRTRVASRVIGPDVASLPAMVHPAFRPDPVTARGPAYDAAYRDVVATMGRTTVLSPTQYEDLKSRRLDFSMAGSAGLNAFVTGLRDAVGQAARLVNGHARDQAAGQPSGVAGSAGYVRADPAAPWEHLPEIDTLVTEGFLRANLPRLLAGEGVPVSLPGEYHKVGLPGVSRSLTMSAFLVPASDAAGHQAPEVSNESYVEDDTKITAGRGAKWAGGLSFSSGPTVELGSSSVKTSGSGNSTDSAAARDEAGLAGQRHPSRATGSGSQGHPGSGDGPGSKSGSSINSRRTVQSRVGVTADGSATVNLSSSSRSATAGTIDIGLLTEPKGQHVARAHLVLRFESARQPADAGLLGVKIGRQSIAERIFGAGALSHSRDTKYLLVENAVELFKSNTMHEDLQTVASRDDGHPASSPPKGEAPELPAVPDDETAYAVGFPVHFDVSRVRFTGGDRRRPGQELPAVTGLTEAIRAGLRATGLVGEQYLNDTSDVWRAITARYDSEAVRTHLHDLLGVGIIHRAEIPVSSLLPLAAGRTRRLTIMVTGTAGRLTHVRSRVKDAVTFGGQALEQRGHDSEASFRAGLSVNFDGRYSGNRRSYLQAALGVGADGENIVSTGSEDVTRDIRRSAGGGKDSASEEFGGELGLRVEIFADTEQIEPLRRVVQYNSWLASALDRSGAADAGPAAALVTFASDPSTPATARLAIPRSLTRLAPTGRQGIPPEVVLPPAFTVPARHPVDFELGGRLLALQFPDLDWVARWAPATVLPLSLAESHVSDQTPAKVDILGPTTDEGQVMLHALGNRYVRNNVAALFRHQLLLTDSNDNTIFLGARSHVLRRLGPAGHYSGLSFREEAQEPTVVLSGRSESRVTLATGGGSAQFSSVPEFLAPEWQSGRSFRGFNGDYREFNESFRDRAYLYGGHIAYDISRVGGYYLTVESGGQFTGLLLEPWARQLAEEYPSRVVHPYATELPASQDERSELIERLGRHPARADGERLERGEPVRLLADPGLDADRDEFIDSARSLAIRLGDRIVDLSVLTSDGTGRTVQLKHFVFGPEGSTYKDDSEAYQRWLQLRKASQQLGQRRRELAAQLRDGASERLAEELETADQDVRKNIEEQDKEFALHRRSVRSAKRRGEQSTMSAENQGALVRPPTGTDPLDTAWRAVGPTLVLPSAPADMTMARELSTFADVTNVLIGGGRTAADGFVVRSRELTTAELASQIFDRLRSQQEVHPLVVLHVHRGEELGRALSQLLLTSDLDVTVICASEWITYQRAASGSGKSLAADGLIAYHFGVRLAEGRREELLSSLLDRVRAKRAQQVLRRPPLPPVTEGDE
jgi:hypothetical protein